MKEKEEKMHFPKIDDFFTTQEERDAEKLEKVEKIAVSSISNFPNHPYQVKENEEMEYLLPVACRSISNCNFKNIVYGRSETR